MDPDVLLLAADRVGTYVFALSGGVAAVRLRVDFFAVVLMSFLPAIGGGTLRDLLLDSPVFWLEDPAVLAIAALGGLTAFFFAGPVEGWKPLRWADAMGLAFFAVTGTAKTGELGFGIPIMLVMGVITATFGGLLRDVVANREPLLLRNQEVYATAALFGAVIYAVLSRSPATEAAAFAGGCAAAFILRGAGIIFKWRLPLPRS